MIYNTPMNILLFGGSFNPPHLGHEIVIRQAFELIPNIDELWLLPTYSHAFGKDLAPAPHRIQMCNLLINSCRSNDFLTQESERSQIKKNNCVERIKVCSLEIDHQTSGSTHESLKLLKKTYPTHTFSFLMGSDQLPSFNKWKNYQQLLKEMPFYVYPRGSHQHNITYPHMTLLESSTQVITNISSTLIRNRIKTNLPIDHILPSSILTYLTTHHLYF
ncbi:MAG TPA: nicotinate-nicotinamide nucleotide adenylyltransferase [Anaerolineales bacterium]|nr:nicotinate-nicotinamide nucleotide adenylyltransferase [Anaerolineales bacterium]